MHSEKSALRQIFREKWRGIDPQWRLAASESVAERLSALEIWRTAKKIGLFAGRNDEVETALFWPEAVSGKEIYYPKIVEDDLSFRRVNKLNELAGGLWNIGEPTGDEAGMPDLLLVPGVAFDEKGGRLGRGKGFYDRWLAGHPTVATLGICFDFQILEIIPMQPHDRRMDGVLTEKMHYKAPA